MKKEERTKQLRSRIFWFFWIIFCILCWTPFFIDRVFAADTAAYPIAGASTILLDVLENPEIEVEETEIVEEAPEYILMGSTAYTSHGVKLSYTHQYPRANHTLAGVNSWKGRRVDLYRCNADGSVGAFMGTYRFEDTGYGKSTGYGSSKLRKGKPLGDIEAGLTIDIWFSSMSECAEWGRRQVYMVWK